jgi:hypothetical protein
MMSPFNLLRHQKGEGDDEIISSTSILLRLSCLEEKPAKAFLHRNCADNAEFSRNLEHMKDNRETKQKEGGGESLSQGSRGKF